MRSNKILITKSEIMEYMGISKVLYQHFLKLGLPVVSINGQKYAHADNLDEWARKKFSRQNCLEVTE